MKNKEEKIDYLNKAISNSDTFVYDGPRYLYKYRSFDEFSFDMLDNNYIFLCAAKDLDDETECKVSITDRDLYDFQTNSLKPLCVEQIILMLKPYCSQDVYETIRQNIYRVVSRDGTVRNHFLLDLAPEIQEAAPVIGVKVVNWLSSIPEKLDDPYIKEQITKLIIRAIQARETIGICSLSENNDIDYMWEKYAGSHSGYCIEYDFSEYKYSKNVLPVIYEDNRQTSVVMSLVSNYIGGFVNSFSDNQMNADISQYIRLFLTKNTKWEYQNEWRVIGDANEKPKAPKISKIIVGMNASLENKRKIKEFCDKNSIVYEELTSSN